MPLTYIAQHFRVVLVGRSGCIGSTIMGKPQAFEMTIGENCTPESCLPAEVLANEAGSNHRQPSQLRVVHKMRKFGGRPPDSPRKPSFPDLLRIVEMVHEGVGGEGGAKIIKRSLQDRIPYRERKTPSVVGSRLLSDLYRFSRDTVAR